MRRWRKGRKMLSLGEDWGSISIMIFGGRLAEYRYYDMDKVIESAMRKASTVLREYQ